MAEKSWFVIQTRAGREREARTQLQQQGFTTYLPTALQRITHARKVSWQPRPFLPGYLFVQLTAEQQRWTTIRSTRGVIGPVRFGMHCPVVDCGIIATLRSHENAAGQIVLKQGRQTPFKNGERVRLLDGPMAGLEGVFNCMQGEERAVVFLQLLQRQVQVTVRSETLAAA